MIFNYFKLAIKVLNRRKFFTFISLFGISFTLMILMTVTAFLETELGDHQPFKDKDKMVFIPMVKLELQRLDTTYQIDSSLQNGVMKYDTTTEERMVTPSVSVSSLGYNLVNNHLREVPGAENYTAYSFGYTFDVFINSNKLNLKVIYSDDRFWDVYNFDFLQGGPYHAQQLENQAQVAVISEKAAESYFGSTENIIGKEIEFDNKTYEVIGLIKNSHAPRHFVSADVYVPYTNMRQQTLDSKNFMGPFEVAFVSGSASGRQQIKDDLNHIASSIQMPNPENYNVLKLTGMTFNERYAHRLYFHENPQTSLKVMLGILAALLSLFFLLPTLNLINVNISRIMERSDEIGVRKAFGASQGTILFQFIFENVVLTLLGGVIGFVLAWILLTILNDSNVLGDTKLFFNFKVFFYSIVICIFFGILSGFIPAYRMSKVHIVNALKQNQL